jgi:hypothetical protein
MSKMHIISKGKINMAMGSDISPYTKEMMRSCSLERGKQNLSDGTLMCFGAALNRTAP